MWSKSLVSNVTEIDFPFNYEDCPTVGACFFGSNSQAAVYTDGCTGYYVFDIFRTHFDCADRAHYGNL